MNGLRSQVLERVHAIEFPPRHDAQALRRIAEELDHALEVRNAEQIADIMRTLLNLIRHSLQLSFNDMEHERKAAIT